MLELVELTGFEKHHPVAALGRDAAARLDRAGALVLAAAAADGRAVRRARRDDPGADEQRAAADLAGDALDGRLRHPLDRRVGLPLHPGRRHVGTSRPDRRDRRDRPAAAARLRDPGGPALRRARHARCGGCSARATRSTRPKRTRRRSTSRRRGCERRRSRPRPLRAARSARVSAAAPSTGSRPRSCSCSGSSLWEGLVRGLDIQRFLLPAPSAILDTLWERRDELLVAPGSTRSRRRSAAS